MFKRITLGFAAGYLIGARGGEKNYKQLKRLGQQLQEIPTVKQFLEQGGKALRNGSERALESVKTKVEELGPEADESDEGPADAGGSSRRKSGKNRQADRDDTDEGQRDASNQGSNAADSGDSGGAAEDGDEDEEHSGGPASSRSLANSIAHAAHSVYARGKVA